MKLIGKTFNETTNKGAAQDFLKRHRFNIINNSYFSRCDPARKYSDFSMKPY